MYQLNQLINRFIILHLLFIHYQMVKHIVWISGIKHLFQVIQHLMFIVKIVHQQQLLLFGVDLEQQHGINGHMVQLISKLLMFQQK